jgi:hypothetical protein
MATPKSKTIGKPAATNAVRHETSAQPSTDMAPPPPDRLLELALDEPDRRILDDYTSVIRVLKDDKRFTFREIAEWLRGHGVLADHNTIYRAYRKTLPPEMAERLDQATSLEQNEQKG